MGIGTDIVQIPRIEKVLHLYGQIFIRRILSEEEIQKMNLLKQDQYGRFLAKRFAAKEAISKALGTGIGANLRFKDISVLNDKLGKPLVKICHPKYQGELGQKINIHLSISDDYPISVAFAIITLSA